jgi:ferrous iron transport protein A
MLQTQIGIAERTIEKAFRIVARKIPLTKAPTGLALPVVEIHGGRAVSDRLRALGIRPGVKLTKISGPLGHGPLIFRHGRAQTALGYGIAQKVIVEVPE